MNTQLPANLITHDADKCSGQHCCVHNPSDHHMREWSMHWRSDTGVMERICPHGIGHPDPDDAAHNIRMGKEHLLIHGCDGCCKPPEKAMKAIDARTAAMKRLLTDPEARLSFEKKCRESAAAAIPAATKAEPPSIDRCLELADTFCHPESWRLDFWRAPMAILAAEVRKLREEVSRLEDKCESMHYECLDRSIPYE